MDRVPSRLFSTAGRALTAVWRAHARASPSFRGLVAIAALLLLADGGALRRGDAGPILGAAVLVAIVLVGVARGHGDRELRRLHALPDLLRLHPRRFERFCRELLEAEGYAVLLTRPTNDFGVDLLLRGADGAGVAQVKRWRSTPVGRPHVQQLYGEMVHRQARYGYFITTSYFTHEARTWARGKRLTLIDGSLLAAIAARHFDRTRRPAAPHTTPERARHDPSRAR